MAVAMQANKASIVMKYAFMLSIFYGYDKKSAYKDTFFVMNSSFCCRTFPATSASIRRNSGYRPWRARYSAPYRILRHLPGAMRFPAPARVVKSCERHDSECKRCYQDRSAGRYALSGTPHRGWLSVP